WDADTCSALSVESLSVAAQTPARGPARDLRAERAPRPHLGRPVPGGAGGGRRPPPDGDIAARARRARAAAVDHRPGRPLPVDPADRAPTRHRLTRCAPPAARRRP